MKTFNKKGRVLFVSSEVYPFAKTGGLADVSFSLPKALSSMYELSIMMPLYRFIDKTLFDIRPLGLTFELSLGRKKHKIDIYTATFENIQVYFVETDILSQKKSLYGTPEQGYKDNDLRFGLFCRAVVAFVKQSEEPYALLHLNDWQTALCALFVKEDPAIHTKTLYTIHNLAYQGVFEKKSLKQLGLKAGYFHIDSMEFYGSISFMKAGIAYADAVTTVSSNYAKEILTPEFGCGLEGFLTLHEKKLSGILNGIDTALFSPSSDKNLIENFDSEHFDKKRINKAAFLKESGLADPQKALLVFVGRFTWQKGIDLLVKTLDTLSRLDLNITLLGDGEESYHQALKEICSTHPNVSLCFGYNESLAHRSYAAADFLLMPSLFEPCGLNQLIAMHYGTMPIVHYVGGLKDSVLPLSDIGGKDRCGFGIGFHEADPHSFVAAVKSALELYKDKVRFEEINRQNMECDLSWKKGAKAYSALYASLLDQHA